MRILITNIKKLLHTYTKNNCPTVLKGKAMNELPFVENAFLLIENNKIAQYDSMQNLNTDMRADKTIDAKQGIVMPAWIDSHTHLVHAATREEEFAMRIAGVSYEQIAANGGGILNSANKLQAMSEDELFDKSLARLHNAKQLGTGVIEIKSGYGLTVDAELKMLRVIQRLKNEKVMPVKATFLGAHAFPAEFKNNQQGYIDLICNSMIPQIADEGLAEYIDVFCEKGFFSVEQTSTILECGLQQGLLPKIHANQLHISGGVQCGVKYNAVSVDHLESMGQEEVDCLLQSNTMPVLLPGAAFFLNMHYQPARMLIDAGLPVALASDYNPGSCPSFNMNFVTSLACTQMKMTTNEAINACTINAAAALQLSQDYGTITVGKTANVLITKPIDNEALIPYWFGESLVREVISEVA
jgi:imidazolonepropionase